MKRYLYRWFAGLQIGCVLLTGCHPTQPFFLGERSDLAHYLDRAQQIDYVDLKSETLPEASDSHEPFSLINQNFEMLDLSLEECISYALNNIQVVHTLPGSQRQNADMAATILSSQSQQLSTSSDVAITATTTNSQPPVTDQNGNRILPRGSSRANQVGGVEDALSEFDAQYTSFLSYNTTDRARNVGAGNVFNPQLFHGNDTTAQMAISKRIATGGVGTLRSQSIGSFNNIPTQSEGVGNFGRAVPTDYTQIFEAQIQHPLMRGRGTLVNRIPIVLARINEDISIGQWEERIRNLVREVEFAYWDLFAAYFNVDTARIAVDSAAFTWRNANARREVQGTARDQKAQAQVTYHQFQAQLDAAIAGGGTQGNDPGLYGREQILRLHMGWAANDGRLIRPSDKPAIGLAEFDWNTARGETLCRNIDLRQQKWNIKQRELELMSAKNQALPDLSVTLNYRWLGVGSNLIDRHGENAPFPLGNSSAFEELFGGNYQEGGVRLDFSPNAFGSRRPLNDVQNKQLTLAREHRILEAKEIAAVHKLSALWQQVDSLHKQMTQQFHAFSAAQTLVEVFNDQLELKEDTRNIIDNLLRAQQTRSQAALNYIRALTEYNKSLVDLHAIKGSLLEYNNIALEEGLWPQKAYWDAEERARERGAARHMDYGASRPSVISRGAYAQNIGTANAQARPASLTPGGPAPAKTPETVPSVPERSTDRLPEKQASIDTKPKFNWDKNTTRN